MIPTHGSVNMQTTLDSHVPTLLLKCFNRLKFSSKHDFSLLGPKADFISAGTGWGGSRLLIFLSDSNYHSLKVFWTRHSGRN